MHSIVLCYAPADEAFARDLARSLEANLPVEVSCSEGVIGPGRDLLEAADLALSAEVALVLLSPASVPKVWNRKTWEPAFFDRPKEFQTLIGFVLLRDCTFPALLRRERFFDATTGHLAAAREIKRWLLRPTETFAPAPPIAPEFAALHRLLADTPGIAADIPVDLALRFASECEDDFETVLRFDCTGRTRAGVTGDIGTTLGLPMSGTLAENHAALTLWCDRHRVLFLFAGVSAEDRDSATPGGRASVLFTAPHPDRLPGALPSGAADAVRRFEATLIPDPIAALRLGWLAVNLLKAQERFVEVAEILDAMAAAARHRADTTSLQRIEREQFWLGGDSTGGIPIGIPADGEQLTFAF